MATQRDATVTAAYRRHHDVEAPRIDATAFRQGWRVRSRLDALYGDGRISAAEFQAAIEYRNAWEVLARSGSSEVAVRSSGYPNPHSRMLALCDASTRIRETDAALGSLAASLCHAVIVEDRTWAEVGRRWHRDPQTVRQWSVQAIASLALAWSRSEALPAPTRRRTARGALAAS